MRKQQILLGALAALSMGLYSCSNEDAPNVDNGATVKGDRYMAVRISTAGLTGTRAGEGYEDGKTAADAATGEKNEGTVTTTNTRFFFFDASGNPFSMESAGNVNGTVTSNMVAPTEVKPGNSDGNTAAGEAVLVLGKAVGQGYEGTVPSKAVCLVGLSDWSGFDNISLSQLAGKVEAYESAGFVMATSNWEGTNEFGAVNISDKIAGNPAAAEANPADFYIERLAVKVRFKENSLKSYMSLDAEGNEAVYKVYDAAGQAKNVKLRVNLTDWQLVKKSDNAYIIKHLPTPAPTWEWNKPDYHRCFWAANTAGAEIAPAAYDIYSEEGWLTNAKVDYTNEWIPTAAVSVLNDRNAATTGIVIRGNVQMADEDTDNWENLSLVRWAGTYYDFASFRKMVADSYNNDNSANVAAADVALVDDPATDDNTYKVQVNGTDYTKYTKVQYWNDGKTSFYLNIANENNAFGVVRNHIYEYDVEKVIGLGFGGNEPKGPEDTETFVAARLTVLNWKVVSNKVTLQ